MHACKGSCRNGEGRTLRSDTFGTMRSVCPATAGSMAMAMLASPDHRNAACRQGGASDADGVAEVSLQLPTHRPSEPQAKHGKCPDET